MNEEGSSPAKARRGIAKFIPYLLIALLLLAFWFIPRGRPGGSGFPIGSCCGGGWGAPLSRGSQPGTSVTEAARRAGLTYAKRKFGSLDGITVKANDYGCHIGVDVYRRGKLAQRLAYRGGGRVDEI